MSMPSALEHSGTSWRGQSLKHDTSILDYVDPRVRIIALTLLALVVVLSPSILVQVMGLLISFLLVLIARLNLKRTLRRLIAVDSFMIFILLMLPFTTPGTPFLTIGSVSASHEGLQQAMVIILKANAVVLAMLALLGTLSASTFGHALSHLKVPEKLIHIMLFTVRYLDVIGQEYKRMRKSMKARAFRAGANRHTWRTMGYLVGMLLIRALERSENIFKAMKCRGYTGQFYLLDDMQVKSLDILFMVAAAISLSILLSLNWVHLL